MQQAKPFFADPMFRLRPESPGRDAQPELEADRIVPLFGAPPAAPGQSAEADHDWLATLDLVRRISARVRHAEESSREIAAQRPGLPAERQRADRGSAHPSGGGGSDRAHGRTASAGRRGAGDPGGGTRPGRGTARAGHAGAGPGRGSPRQGRPGRAAPSHAPAGVRRGRGRRAPNRSGGCRFRSPALRLGAAAEPAHISGSALSPRHCDAGSPRHRRPARRGRSGDRPRAARATRARSGRGSR